MISMSTNIFLGRTNKLLLLLSFYKYLASLPNSLLLSLEEKEPVLEERLMGKHELHCDIKYRFLFPKLKTTVLLHLVLKKT